MAGYKAHMATGILLGGIATVGAVIAMAVDIILSPFIFIAVVIGSFLPDIDSDTGIPVRILFSVLGFLTLLIVLYILRDNFGDNYLKSVLLLLVAYGFVDIILRKIFNKFTKHRGVFHSLLAVAMSMLSLNIILLKAGLFYFDAATITVALGVGYLGHLLLDELNSVVNLSGIPFIPNKSLGSALKFGSKSLRVNIIAIVIVVILLTLTSFHFDT